MGFSGLLQVESHVTIHLFFIGYRVKYQMRNGTPCLEAGNVQSKKQIMLHKAGQFGLHSKASNQLSRISHKLTPQTTGSG